MTPVQSTVNAYDAVGGVNVILVAADALIELDAKETDTGVVTLEAKLALNAIVAYEADPINDPLNDPELICIELDTIPEGLFNNVFQSAAEIFDANDAVNELVEYDEDTA